MHSGCLEHDDYTVGWICALPKELTAARAMLDNIHPDLHVPPGDYNTYCLGSIGTHNIAIACLPLGEIGTNSAATVASRMLVTFRSIRFGLMVGIGGGVPGKRHEIQLGDVVVSMPTGQHGGVVQWDFGKSVGAGGGFERTGSLNRPPQVLMAALSKLISNHDLEGSKTGTYLADMMARYPPMTKYALQPDMTDVLFPAECSHVDDNETCEECDHGKALIRIPRSAPAVHYGLIASGNQVIKDGTKRDKISRDLGGVLCFEMEAAGLQNQFQCLVIRGICDYADSHKNKVWQEYAAVAAAAFAKELVMIIPAHEVANTRTLKVVISETVRTSMQAQRDEEQASKSLQTLRTSNYELFKARNPDRVDGTCQWFLEHPTFVEWRDRKTSSLLWLSADPGCGKSVLSKSLVDKELASSASRTTCYFFFKEDDPTQRSVSNAMCAILHQLLTQNKPLRKHALTAFDENGSELPYLFDTLWGILTTAVRDTEAGEVVCILDGLDECEKDGRDGIGMEGLIETLTSFFCNEQGSNSHRLKFLVTSRPYYDIERLFNTLVSIQPMARLSGEEEATHISKEIDLVIKVKVKDLVTYLGLPGSAISFLETELSKVTHRTYLWLKLIIELIRNDPHITTEKKLRKAISTMPRTVDDAYEAILKRSTDMDEAKKLLHIVVAATRPLTIQEMNFALAIDEHTRSHEDLDLEPERPFLTRIKNLCGLLVTVIDSKIYFIHETVKQFLLSTAAPSPQQVQRRRVPSYWKHALRLEESHHVLAEICLAYLLLPAFEYEPMMIDADINIHDFQKAIDEYSTEHKFLKYTAECWSFHFREAQVTEDSALIQSALHVCDTETKRFLTWFPIHWLSVDFSVCPSGFTDLIVCTTLGLTLLVQRLLAQEKVNVTAPHPDTGMTPLMWAAEAGSERIVRVLLDQPGVLPAEADPFSGRTPVWWAAVGGHEAVMRLLLHQEIVDPDAAESRYGRTPLSWAASLGNEGILRQLLRDSRVNPDSKGNNGRTPLSWAAGEGSVGSVRLLLERNADPNSVDNRHGWTPLAWAADKGHETIIQLLLACKCINPDPKDTRNGRTPLSLAAERGHEPVSVEYWHHTIILGGSKRA
ncbi:uncharacterized protein LDX57_012681 [Aspergillus melleus]|uniref:uncharacterized protein n=1 Tax=Aspergillus melleus TaxID=138277 RepID=UPI001E8E7A88|nr:uncharacterized protein LDX57_012681 [Aspergillus melleus]KAH8435052.1 hypothetical protein LDX57_012681 [Aspergillus melleus]